MALNSGIKQGSIIVSAKSIGLETQYSKIKSSATDCQYSEILSLDTKLRSINVSAKSIGLETQYSKIKTTTTDCHEDIFDL